jgi:hypothetical protein
VPASFCPVRELPPGGRPCDWMNAPFEASAPALAAGSPPDVAQADGLREEMGCVPAKSSELSAPARIFGPLRYKIEFTATEEFVEVMERARALLSKRRGPASNDESQMASDSCAHALSNAVGRKGLGILFSSSYCPRPILLLATVDREASWLQSPAINRCGERELQRRDA